MNLIRLIEAIVTDKEIPKENPEQELAQKALQIKRETGRLKLLSVLNDPKTLKSYGDGSRGHLTAVLYLMPSRLSGRDVCPCSSKECEEVCIHYAGNPARMSGKEKGRLRKTKWYFGDKDANPYFKKYEATQAGFIMRLQDELNILKAVAQRHNLEASVRLNGTSDLNFHKHLDEWKKENPDVKFYDYTKVVERAMQALQNKQNVHFTVSRSEDIENNKKAERYLQMGGNVAVVFDQLPEYYRGYKVINGDETDLRFLDDSKRETDENGNPIGVIVGLKMKGPKANALFVKNLWAGKGPEDGFVIRVRELKITNPEALTSKKTGFSSRTEANPDLAKRLYLKKIKNYMALLSKQSLQSFRDTVKAPAVTESFYSYITDLIFG
jgi:hypothetical protein